MFSCCVDDDLKLHGPMDIPLGVFCSLNYVTYDLFMNSPREHNFEIESWTFRVA